MSGPGRVALVHINSEGIIPLALSPSGRLQSRVTPKIYGYYLSKVKKSGKWLNAAKWTSCVWLDAMMGVRLFCLLFLHNYWHDAIGIDIVTPLLDGTILPGVTRDSIISLAANHNKGSPLPGIPSNVDVRVREDTIYMSHLVLWEKEGRLLEAFGSGTAAILVGVWRVGWEGRDILFGNGMQDELKDGEKDVNGLGPVGEALYDQILEIQGGRIQGHEWSVSCADWGWQVCFIRNDHIFFVKVESQVEVEVEIFR
jgi:hypothetical protein